MLGYDRIDIPEGIDANKTKESHRCFMCNCHCFPKVNFRFLSKTCNGFHDLMQKTMSFNDVIIVSFKGSDYRIHFWYMGKDKTINLFYKWLFKGKKTGPL